MENISQYIDVLIQAPVAVITMFLFYLIFKLLTAFLTKQVDVLKNTIISVTKSLDEAIKIIKQQERKS